MSTFVSFLLDRIVRAVERLLGNQEEKDEKTSAIALDPMYWSLPNTYVVRATDRLDYRYEKLNLIPPTESLNWQEEAAYFDEKSTSKQEESLLYFLAFDVARRRREQVAYKGWKVLNEVIDNPDKGDRMTYKASVKHPKVLNWTKMSWMLDPRILPLFSDEAKRDGEAKLTSMKNSKGHEVETESRMEMTFVDLHMVHTFRCLLQALLAELEFQSWVVSERIHPEVDPGLPPSDQWKPYMNVGARTVIPNPTQFRDPMKRVPNNFGIPRYPRHLQQVLMVVNAAVCHPRSQALVASVFGPSFQGNRLSQAFKAHFGIESFQHVVDNQARPILDVNLSKEKTQNYEFMDTTVFQNFRNYISTPLDMIVGVVKKHHGPVKNAASKSTESKKFTPLCCGRYAYNSAYQRHSLAGYLCCVADIMEIAYNTGPKVSNIAPLKEIHALYGYSKLVFPFLESMMEDGTPHRASFEKSLPLGYPLLIDRVVVPILTELDVPFQLGKGNTVAAFVSTVATGDDGADSKKYPKRAFFMRSKPEIVEKEFNEETKQENINIWDCDKVDDNDIFRIEFGEPFNCNLVEFLNLLVFLCQNPFEELQEEKDLRHITLAQKEFLGGFFEKRFGKNETRKAAPTQGTGGASNQGNNTSTPSSKGNAASEVAADLTDVAEATLAAIVPASNNEGPSEAATPKKAGESDVAPTPGKRSSPRIKKTPRPVDVPITTTKKRKRQRKAAPINSNDLDEDYDPNNNSDNNDADADADDDDVQAIDDADADGKNGNEGEEEEVEEEAEGEAQQGEDQVLDEDDEHNSGEGNTETDTETVKAITPPTNIDLSGPIRTRSRQNLDVIMDQAHSKCVDLSSLIQRVLRSGVEIGDSTRLHRLRQDMERLSVLNSLLQVSQPPSLDHGAHGYFSSMTKHTSKDTIKNLGDEDPNLDGMYYIRKRLRDILNRSTGDILSASSEYVGAARSALPTDPVSTPTWLQESSSRRINDVLAVMDVAGSMFHLDITEKQLSHLRGISKQYEIDQKDVVEPKPKVHQPTSLSLEMIQFAMGIRSAFTDKYHSQHPFPIICSPILSELLVTSKDPKLVAPYLHADPKNPITQALVSQEVFPNLHTLFTFQFSSIPFHLRR